MITIDTKLDCFLFFKQGYLVYMSNASSSASEDNKRSLTTEQILNLFGNIEDIYEFNSSFLSELEKQDLEPVGIAKCFVKRAEGFDVYTQYCTNYPRTVSLITDLMRIKETAEMFKERQLTLKQSLPLGSYLLKPVQRILKYHLLLQNIVKNTDKESEGYEDIKNALSVMTNIACHINNMKRKHEHAVRVQEIQSLLYGWEGQDLTTYGELMAEGAFRMFGAKAFRHLFLFEKMLLIAKKKEGMLNYKTHILCSNLMLIESIKGEPLCFHTIPFDNPRVQYTFQARNLDQKREWCLQLKRVILENYNAVIPSHAKQIVLELGQSSQEENIHSSGKRTLSAPEYLERRKHDRNKSESLNHSLHKGFKLRKSLKKLHAIDSINGSRRIRSSSHDETAACALKDEALSGRRSSLGLMSSSDERSDTNVTKEGRSDTKDLKEANVNILNVKVPPRTFRTGQSANASETTEDYVTFYFNRNRVSPNNACDDSGVCSPSSSDGSYNLRASTPISSDSGEFLIDENGLYLGLKSRNKNYCLSLFDKYTDLIYE
ncbi:uncharacterized protein B4U79_13565 [Dinothrombium tinctorium]|uniref:DH domain-containing protein n=1 Tax=Dinothrombium tinctorium TaxID=1965070 RepID=A0A3S3Q4L7_9ACAR|nr:uncharacterized protein B4U79_03431 [Dinothrombium tinctorium]RWS13883.1 uncharacterized protein B4U79_13565 [Dinothrombium tinctorium]